MAAPDPPTRERRDLFRSTWRRTNAQQHEMQLTRPARQASPDASTDPTQASLVPRASQVASRATSGGQVTLEAQPGQHLEGCSWEDVIDSIDKAREEYEGKTGKNRLRVVPRSQVIVTTLHGLTEMIPEQDGLSILRGGLKLVFGLMHKRIENQEQIFQVFEDIPLIFSKACDACKIYPRDEALRNTVFDLYRVLREEIPKLTDILLRQHKGSLPSRIFQQHPQNEATAITQTIESVARASARVTDRVGILLGKTVVATLRQTEFISADVRQVGIGVKLIHDRQLETIERSSALEERYAKYLDAMAGAFDAKLENATRRLTAEIRNIQPGGLPAPGAPAGYIGPDTASPFLALYATSPMPSQDLLLPPSSPIYSYEQLYELAGLPTPETYGYDLDEIQRLKARLNDAALGRGTWLMTVDRFCRWLDFRSGGSDLILVDGNMDDTREGKLTPLSAFCGSFVDARKGPQFLTLYHFCGLHAHLSNHSDGPRGMLRGLIAQLLWWYQRIGTPLRISLADTSFDELNSQQISSLLTLLQELVQQVPEGVTVYFLIDGISEYETVENGWESEACEVVALFQSLVDEHRARGPLLKFLLTAAQRSIAIVQKIDPNDQIVLSSSNVLPRSVGASFEKDLQAAMADTT